MNNRGQRMPIFHDDLRFRDRHAQTFDDMERQMNDDIWLRGSGGGGGGNWRDLDRHMRSPPIWDNVPEFRSQPPLNDSFQRMCDGFFQLKPKPLAVDRLQRSTSEFGSRESLDDDTLSSMVIEDPRTHSRMFEISFDVKDYPPNCISVKTYGETLAVESRNDHDGRFFSRSIKLPRDVDSDKLSSEISSDGVLTVRAPLPPRYQNVVTNRRSETPPTRQQQPRQNQQSPSPIQQQPQQQQQQQQPQQPPQQQRPPCTVSSTASIPQPSAPQTPDASQPNNVMCQQFSTPVSSASGTSPLDVPVYVTTQAGTRKMELLVEMGSQFGVNDIIVKVTGLKLVVEATRAQIVNNAKSTSTTTREYNLSEAIDPDTIQATLSQAGVLKVSAVALQNFHRPVS